MLAYFLRRLAGGVATFLLASMVLYTAIVPLGASVLLDTRCMDCYGPRTTYLYLGIYDIYKLDRAWPSNYFTWLYDPDPHDARTFTFKSSRVQSGLILPARTVQLTSGGLLRGDFGQSLLVRPGTPVLDMYGIELLPWTAFMWTLLFGSMAVAYLQRRKGLESIKAQRVWLL